jgi:hypothetical protein
MGGFVIVPYLRRKADLISPWTMLLLGVSIFVGIGCLEAFSMPMRFPGLQWFESTRTEVNRYIFWTTTFLAALFVTYYYDPVSRKLANGTLSKWPPPSTPVLLLTLSGCLALIALYWATASLHLAFIGPALLNISHKAMLFACVFSMILWYRNKVNPVWLITFIAVFIAMCMFSMLMAHGRRMLLSVFMVPVLVVYYYDVRNWKPTKGMAAVGVAVVSIFVLNLMYSSIRHYDWQTKEQRSAAGIVKQIQGIGEKDWFERFANNSLFHFSQQVVHYALVTDHFVTTGRLEPQPFNTFKFFVAYPIPRRLWPEKPQILGIILPRDILGRSTNWGTGIAGHAAFEGGWIVAALFGYIGGAAMRLFGDAIRRQPTNPFLIAMFATASTHILAWPRGDLAIMTLEIVECYFFAIGFGIVGRILFGTQRSAVSPAVVNRHVRFAYRSSALGRDG